MKKLLLAILIISSLAFAEQEDNFNQGYKDGFEDGSKDSNRRTEILNLMKKYDELTTGADRRNLFIKAKVTFEFLCIKPAVFIANYASLGNSYEKGYIKGCKEGIFGKETNNK